MKISSDNQQVNFKQIKLNEQEKQTAKALFERLKATTCSKESFLLHTQIFDVFSKHLDAESQLKSDGLAWKAGQFAKDIYIKFFAALRDVKLGIIEPEKFVNTLNTFSEEEFEPNSYGNEESLSKINIYNFNKNALNVSEKMHISIAKYLDCLHKYPKKEIKFADDIFNNSNIAANMLGVNAGSFHRILTKFAIYEMLFHSPEDINTRCEQNSKELNIPKETFVEQIMKVGRLLSMQPEKTKLNKTELMNILKLENDDDFNKIFLKNPKILLINPSNIKSNIEKYSQMWDVDEEKIINAFVENPSFIVMTPESTDDFCDNVSLKLNITKEEFLNAAFKRPKVFTFKSEIIENNIVQGAKILGISQEEYTKLALRNPRIFTCHHESLKRLYERTINEMNFSEDLLTKIAIVAPNILTFPFEVMKYNADGIKNLLELSDDMFLAVAYSNPAIYAEKPECIKERISYIASLLEIDKTKAKELSIANPQILTWAEDSILNNMSSTMKYFGVDAKEYSEIIERNPRLITLKLYDIDKFIEKTSEMLNLNDKNLWKDAVRRNAKLATITPEITVERIEENAWALDVPVKDYLKLAFQEPQIFTLQAYMLYDSVTKLPKNIGIDDKSQFKNAIYANPTILTIRHEWLEESIKETSNLLGLETKVFANTALRNPQAFTLSPARIYKNIKEISEILDISFEKAVNLALLNPSVFTLRAKLIKETIDDVCKNFQISPQHFLKMSLRNPHLLSSTYLRFCEVVKDNCAEFKMTPKKFFEIGMKFPSIYTMKHNRLSRATYDSILKLASS